MIEKKHKQNTNILPNGGLMVIYHGKKQKKNTSNKSKFTDIHEFRWIL